MFAGVVSQLKWHRHCRTNENVVCIKFAHKGERRVFARFCEDAPPLFSPALRAKNTDKTGGKKNPSVEIEKHPADFINNQIEQDFRRRLYSRRP